MDNVPVQVIVAAFKDETTAEKVALQLKDAKKQGLIEIEDSIVLTRDMNNKLKIKDEAHMGAGKSALTGGVIGAALSVLAGPVGWMAAGGAAIGALAGKMSQGGVSTDRIKQIGASLKPGTSAIIAVVDHTWVLQAQQMMEQQQADYVMETVSADISKQLSEGKDVVYSALATSSGMAVSRAAGNETEGEYGSITTTDDSTYVEGAHYTPQQVDAAAALITDQGAVGIVASAVPDTASGTGSSAGADAGSGSADSTASGTEDAKPSDGGSTTTQ